MDRGKGGICLFPWYFPSLLVGLIWSDPLNSCKSVGLFLLLSLLLLFVETGQAAAEAVFVTIYQSGIRALRPHNHDPSGVASE
jgi:uncharacterized membrane protein